MPATTLQFPDPDAPSIASELDDFLGYARERLGLSPNTVRAYRSDIRAAAAALPGDLAVIARQDIERYLTERGGKPGTANRRRASLHRFFRWAVREEYRADNPVAEVESVQDEVHLPRPISSDADRRALDAHITAADQPYRLIFTILRETGMRAGEALGLCIGDVTLEEGREALRVREAKNNVDRVVVLTPDSHPKTLRGLRSWLRERKGLPPGDPLFRSQRGTRLSYHALRHQWVRLCEEAGLVDEVEGKPQPRYTLHQLRHTLGTTLIANHPEHLVGRILGHRDPRSARRYAEVSEAQVRAALSGRR